MRKRIGIYGANEESLRLLRLMADTTDVEVVRIFATDRDSALSLADKLGSDLARHVAPLLVDDPTVFLGNDDLHAVVDAGY